MRRGVDGLRAPVRRLRLLHDGQIGDYVAWFTLGLAAFGTLFALALH